MRKVILLNSVLLAAPFMFGEMGEASAQCTTTPSCSSLGYTNGANTGNCIKCPTGNGWFCPPKSDCSCSGFTLTKDQADAQCKGGYQSCKNCSGTVLWKCIGNNEDICISNCSGYTLTENQISSQCRGMEVAWCQDKCDGKRWFKCTYSSSGGGDDDNTSCRPLPDETGCDAVKSCSDGCGGIRRCCSTCTSEPVKANLTRECYCKYVNDSYHLYIYDAYVCVNGRSSWKDSNDFGSYGSYASCNSAISGISYCNSTSLVTPDSKDQASCGWVCVD